MCEATHAGYVCEGRRENHKGMHHDYDKRTYWVVRADGTVEFLAEGPRT